MKADPATHRRTAELEPARLSYLEAAPASASEDRPLVLLHGMPASAELWRDVLEELARAGHRALAPDLPGYGETRLPEGGDHSLDGAADLIEQWLEVTGLVPVRLVGHDLGGGVAQILAGRRPELIARLTLADTVLQDGWPVAPVRIFRAVARLGLYAPLAAAGLVPNPYARRELVKGFARPERIDEETARRVFWDGKVSDPEGRREFARHLAALDPEQTVEAARHLHRYRGPTLLLWGEKDRFLPAHRDAEGFRHFLPGAQLEIVANTGHFAPLERPRVWARALLEKGRRGRSREVTPPFDDRSSGRGAGLKHPQFDGSIDP